MTDFYFQLVEKSGFDEALVRHALDLEKATDINEFSRPFFDTEPFCVENTGVLFFEEAFYPAEFYDRLKNLPFSAEESALYLYIILVERAFCDFSARIDCADIFFDTQKKLVESTAEYFSSFGKYGIYDYRFVANHVRGSVLRLGCFEYQYGSFEDSKAIILHVPEKADMSKELRLTSYALARKYFGEYPIIADSWLLFPENKNMLSGDSMIVDFMSDFDIISTHSTTDYSELFHVFGRLSDFSYENLPKNTALQKAYAERVRKKLPIGSATGILKH